MYELIFKRKRNGQIVEVISFASESKLIDALDYIIEIYNLKMMPKIKRRPDDAWTSPDSDYILLARTLRTTPTSRAFRVATSRAFRAARRAFGSAL
jgi:hypothetical protein